MGYARSWSRDIESYLTMAIGLDEDDIQLILKQYNSHFISYQSSPGICTIKHNWEAVYTMDDHAGTLKIEYDDFSLKIKVVLKRFGGPFGTLRFDEKSFFNILLGFTPYWEYKPTNAVHSDSPGVYSSDKKLNLSTINKIHMKYDVIDGSVVNGLRQPILFSFILDRAAGYRMFRQSETIHYKKINKSVLNTITFYLEYDNNGSVNFNGKTLTSTLEMIKIRTIKWTFKFLKLIHIALDENTTPVQKLSLVR